MGDKILKKLLIFLFFANIIVNAEELPDELKWVDAQIATIKAKRDTLLSAQINTIKNPFIFFKPKKEKEEKNEKKITENNIQKSTTNASMANITKKRFKTKSAIVNAVFNLKAIMNKTALINKKWYKLGDKVGNGYVLSEVYLNYVVLTKRNKKIILTTNSKKYLGNRK
jgi:hypothetical protein